MNKLASLHDRNEALFRPRRKKNKITIETKLTLFGGIFSNNPDLPIVCQRGRIVYVLTTLPSKFDPFGMLSIRRARHHFRPSTIKITPPA